jgi:hypothetical protein
LPAGWFGRWASRWPDTGCNSFSNVDRYLLPIMAISIAVSLIAIAIPIGLSAAAARASPRPAARQSRNSRTCGPAALTA